MYPIETYARLYDEVVERAHGKHPFEPDDGTVWRERGPAERRMTREHDEDLWQAIEAYAASVAAFDRVHDTLDALPTEREEAYAAALPDDRTGRVASPWKHLTAGEDTVWLRYWVTYNVDPIAEADDARQFERKLRNNVERIREYDTHTAEQMVAVYEGWDEDDTRWADEVWAFVTDEELGLKELAEERRQHNRAIAAYAQNLQEMLGAELDAYARPSRLERLKDRLL